MAIMRLSEGESDTFRHDGAVIVKDWGTPEALSALRIVGQGRVGRTTKSFLPD